MNKYLNITENKYSTVIGKVACGLLCLCVCTLIFLFCGIALANTDEQSDKETSVNTQNTQVSEVIYRLRREIISPPQNDRVAESGLATVDDDLQKVIKQIRSARISEEQPAYADKSKADSVAEKAGHTGDKNIEPQIVSENNAVFQSSAADIDTSVIQDDLQLSESKISSGDTLSGISELTVRTIEDLLREPVQSQNVTKQGLKQTGLQYKELAEILFKSGRLKQAGQCYKRAYDLLPADDINLTDDRNWILFQIGNCFEYYDPNMARESFAQLLRTNPNSPWAEVAKFRFDLVDWLEREQPKKLIEELNYKTESNK